MNAMHQNFKMSVAEVSQPASHCVGFGNEIARATEYNCFEFFS